MLLVSLPLLSIAASAALGQAPVQGAAANAADPAKALEARVAQLEQEVHDLRSSLLGLQTVLKEKDAELHEIVQALSRRDGNRQPILALRSIMQSSDEFRREMQQAVNDSIPREGKLRVENQTSGVQFLSINGKTERVDALKTVEFTVPVGTLTTELIGQESSKNWTVGPPAYQQNMVIRPLTRQTVVASPVIIETPVYVLP
jgi:hypothetical protein